MKRTSSLTALLLSFLIIFTACTNENDSPMINDKQQISIEEIQVENPEDSMDNMDIITQEEELAEVIINSRTIDPDKPSVALTLDDGPNMTNAVIILDELEARGIVATYFVIGGNINNDTAEVMRRAYALGCEYANHSWGWNSMGNMESEVIIESLTKTSDKIVEVLDENARPKFFRAPNLNTSPAMIETVKELGYPLMEGILGNDWEGGATSESIYNLVVPRVKDGSIILLHDGGSNNVTAEGIGDILDALINEGYQFVTLSELFELKGVEIEAGKKYGSVS